jgi:hypothetical protein
MSGRRSLMIRHFTCLPLSLSHQLADIRLTDILIHPTMTKTRSECWNGIFSGNVNDLSRTRSRTPTSASKKILRITRKMKTALLARCENGSSNMLCLKLQRLRSLNTLPCRYLSLPSHSGFAEHVQHDSPQNEFQEHPSMTHSDFCFTAARVEGTLLLHESIFPLHESRDESTEAENTHVGGDAAGRGVWRAGSGGGSVFCWRSVSSCCWGFCRGRRFRGGGWRFRGGRRFRGQRVQQVREQWRLGGDGGALRRADDGRQASD